VSEQRLIDANALRINEINPVDYGSIFSYEAHNAVQNCLRDIERIIEQAPTVPAEVVVHCKDCVNLSRDEYGSCCELVAGLNSAREDAFCSYGERK